MYFAFTCRRVSMRKFLALAAMAVMGASFATADTLFATLDCTGVDSYDAQGSRITWRA